MLVSDYKRIVEIAEERDLDNAIIGFCDTTGSFINYVPTKVLNTLDIIKEYLPIPEESWGEFKCDESMKKIEEILEYMEVIYKYYKEDGKEYYYGLIEFWTDTAGQDIITDFYYDGTAKDFVDKFTERALSYNVDTEVELNIDSRGKYGVPDTVEELLNDCKEAKDTLMSIAKKLQESIA